MFSEYLQLITEILSAKEYKKYKKEDKKINFEKFSVKEYKKVLPVLKKIFKDLNKGKFARTVIFDYNSLGLEDIRLNSEDKKLIKILNDAGYEVTEESYKLGMGLKNNKTIIINDIIVSLRSKNIDKLNQAYEKTKKEEIKKQIELVDNVDQISYHYTAIYKIAQTDKFKIVLTIESRKIASQSTKTGWSSCMRFDRGGGEYRQYVMSGIQEGVIIAYLVRTGDEKRLQSPTARVLIKPLKAVSLDEEDEKNPQIIWVTDVVYGDAPSNSDFKNKVQKIFDKYSSKENGIFRLNTKNIYQDDISSTIKKSDPKFDDINSFEEFDKLSFKDKLLFSGTYNNSYLNYLDYSDEESVKLYMTYCLRVYNDVYSYSSIDYPEILRIAPAKQIVELYKLNNEAFIRRFSKHIDSKKAIELAKTKDEEIIKYLLDTDKLPKIYLKKLGIKSIYEGMPISEFLSYIEEQIKDTEEMSGEIDLALDKLFKKNEDYAKTKKFIINKTISKLISLNYKNGIEYFITRYGNFSEGYKELISKENLTKILEQTIQEGLYCSDEVLRNLGIENIIKFMKLKKLSVRDNIDFIFDDVATFKEEENNLLYRIWTEVFNKEDKQWFVHNIRRSIKGALDYRNAKLFFDMFSKLIGNELLNETQLFFLSTVLTNKEKIELFNKYYKNNQTSVKVFKEFIAKHNMEIYKELFKSAPPKRNRTLQEVFIPE